MTTLVANSSGRKSTKDNRKPNTNTSTNTHKSTNAAVNAASATPPTSVTAANNNSSAAPGLDDELRKSDKFQPTAEQMRIASLMSDKKDENDLKPKIEQIVELTGASRDDAAVALYDCDNDMTKAIEMILDGDALETEWQSTGRKKKTKGGPQVQAAALLDSSAVSSLTNGSNKKGAGDKQSSRGPKNSSPPNAGGDNRNNRDPAIKGGASRDRLATGSASSNNANNARSPRKRDGSGGGGGYRGAAAGDGFRSEGNTTEENDIFAKASSGSANLPGDGAARRGGRRGGGGPRGGGRGGMAGAGSGLPRGGPPRGGGGDRGSGGERGVGDRGGMAMGRGSRTFMNRGLSHSVQSGANSHAGTGGSGVAGAPADGGFPNSIETWTNAVDGQSGAQAKQTADDQMNQIGNWSDIVVNEDWSEEDWTTQPMETKVFTPSTKTIPEKDETMVEKVPQQSHNHHHNNANASQQLSFISGKPNENESAPPAAPTMSAILSASLNKARQQQQPSQPQQQQSAGQAFLQQIQQNQPQLQQQQQQPQTQPQVAQSVSQRGQPNSSLANNHNQQQQQPTYHLSQYQKDATASIKSMVGLGGGGAQAGISSNDLISAASNDGHHGSLAHVVGKQNQQQQQHQQQNRLQKVGQNQAPSRATNKIPESAVEMPSASNDPISGLSVHFGSLEFGSTNFGLGGNAGADTSGLFDTSALPAGQSVATSKSHQQQEASKGLGLLSGDASGAGYGRSAAPVSSQQQQAKQQASMLQSSTVFAQSLNEPTVANSSAVESSHHHANNRADKVPLNSSNYSSGNKVQQQHQQQQQNQHQQAQHQQKNDYLVNSMTSGYKQQVGNDVYSSFTSAYGQVGSTGASQYYQPSQQVFGNQSLNMYSGSAYGSVQQQGPSVKSGRELDASSLGLGQSANSAASSNKYDGSSSVGSLGGLMNNSSVGGNNSSNSTVTTNVLKNTLSASKGVHSVPPGVGVQQAQQQAQQQQQVLSTPFAIMGNNMPIPYPYPYDMQFQTRDHGGYPSYGTAVDVAKYNRGNDGSDMLAPVSSQAAGAGLQSAATQAHNQPYAMNTFPPGYGHFYYNPIPQQGHHAYYASAAQHPMYPVQAAQAAQAGGASAASSAFAKAAAANSANAYGSHSGYTTSSAGYDSLMGAGGSTGGGGLADYGGSVGKGGQGGSSYVGGGQQMGGQAGQHKGQMGGVSASDLSGSGGQSMYGGKNHSSMNKAYEKQAFQQSAQFNMSNSAANAANLSSYGGNPYLLPQQQMQAHHGSMGSGVVDNSGQQSGNGNGGQGRQGSLQGGNQVHKGPAGGPNSVGGSVQQQQAYKQSFAWN